ncbi:MULTISPECIES: metal ABC transporter solute-binding protein, Zn/Mn family [Halomonadaceae]|uniref:metal ABC transporter solute-binding protein, Zn/Mn family n=1 Tax=Halomonadaceae TaxID=28256 RepID=UPI0015973B4D|nr:MULTISPECIES: zinc ABC transporter substrate-binding protein [Halomonas]QJQ95320.1 zinc ABC transporter solute-binding protein [Halomonas sp. PA5]
MQASIRIISPLSRIAPLAWVLLAALLLALSPASRADERLNLVATTAMIADTLREVGGEHVSVRSLMGPGVDPHLYRQTRNDISLMTRADAVFWNGLYLEAQLEGFLERLGARQPVITVGEALPVERRLADEEYPDRHDPHIWMDPTRWQSVVGAIRDALMELSPEHRDTFQTNAQAFSARIASLDEYARDVLESVPEGSRVLVTAHDAFGYFGDAYDFEVLGIQGFSTESEAGLARIESLVNLLVSRRIGAIFVESSVSARNIRALIEGAAAQGWQVEVGGELFSDAMGHPDSYEGSYIGMIDHNVTLIARALGGDAPAGGMQGQLGSAREPE